jgi:hypothetical protein
MNAWRRIAVEVNVHSLSNRQARWASLEKRGATVLSRRLEFSQASVQGLQSEHRASQRVHSCLATNGNDPLKLHLQLMLDLSLR